MLLSSLPHGCWKREFAVLSLTLYWIIGACLLAILVIMFMFRMHLVCAFFAAFLLIVFLRSGIFIVYEGSQVVITQFGNIIGKPYTNAGLYFKVPIVWKANYIDKRYIAEEEVQPEVATKDGYIITLDAVFFWKITNASLYISSVDDMLDAKRLLRNIVSGALRQAIAEHHLQDIVQLQNNDNLTAAQQNSLLGSKLPPAIMQTQTNNNASVGRAKILEIAQKDINQYTKKLGITVPEIIFTSVQYTPGVEDIIEQRMVLERMREAERIRSTGRAEALRIQGETNKKYQSIIAPAKNEALKIQGEAQALATDIQAESFGKDREFYNYWQSLEHYKTNIADSNNKLILSTDLPFLNFMTSKSRKIARPNAEPVKPQRTPTEKKHQQTKPKLKSED